MSDDVLRRSDPVTDDTLRGIEEVVIEAHAASKGFCLGPRFGGCTDKCRIAALARIAREQYERAEASRQRIHEAVDECQRRHAPYVAACVKYDRLTKEAQDEFDRDGVLGGRVIRRKGETWGWARLSWGERMLIIGLKERAEKAEAENARLREALDAYEAMKRHIALRGEGGEK